MKKHTKNLFRILFFIICVFAIFLSIQLYASFETNSSLLGLLILGSSLICFLILNWLNDFELNKDLDNEDFEHTHIEDPTTKEVHFETQGEKR